jgi:hypothetical protein
MKRPTFSELKNLLKNPEVKKEYDRLKSIFKNEKLSIYKNIC